MENIFLSHVLITHNHPGHLRHFTTYPPKASFRHTLLGVTQPRQGPLRLATHTSNMGANRPSGANKPCNVPGCTKYARRPVVRHHGKCAKCSGTCVKYKAIQTYDAVLLPSRLPYAGTITLSLRRQVRWSQAHRPHPEHHR